MHWQHVTVVPDLNWCIRERTRKGGYISFETKDEGE